VLAAEDLRPVRGEEIGTAIAVVEELPGADVGAEGTRADDDIVVLAVGGKANDPLSGELEGRWRS